MGLAGLRCLGLAGWAGLPVQVPMRVCRLMAATRRESRARRRELVLVLEGLLVGLAQVGVRMMMRGPMSDSACAQVTAETVTPVMAAAAAAAVAVVLRPARLLQMKRRAAALRSLPLLQQLLLALQGLQQQTALRPVQWRQRSVRPRWRNLCMPHLTPLTHMPR